MIIPENTLGGLFFVLIFIHSAKENPLCVFFINFRKVLLFVEVEKLGVYTILASSAKN